jgi:flagellar hook-associated protein 3 FlgL
MSITGPGSITAANLLAQTNMFNQLNTLSTELSSGQAAQTYSGLASQAGLALQLNAQLAAINGYSSTASTLGTTLNIAESTLTQIGNTGTGVQQALNEQGTFSVDNTGQTITQEFAKTQLDQILAALNTQVGNNYIFSGSAVNQPAVASTDEILNGNGAQAGLTQVIAERLQADQGADVPPLGRLVIPPVAGSTVSIGEDVAGSPFGFKLAAVNSSLTGAVVTPSGPPTSYSVNLAASNPNPGDSIAFSLNLPDGTSQTITLQATAATTPGPNQFTIGLTPAATAANLQAALTTAVQNLAQTALPAASAIAAANDFFNGETQVTGANNAVDATLASATPSTQSTAALTSTGFGDLQNGDTLTFTLGGTSFTATYVTAAPVGNQFTSLAQLQTLLNTAFNGQAVATLPGAGPDAGGLVLTSDNLPQNFTTGGVNHIAAPATDFAATNANIVPGSELTISDTNNTTTLYYVASNASAANGTFSTLDTPGSSLLAAIANPASSVSATIAPSNNGGALELTNTTGSITVGGAIGSALGFSPGTVDNNVNPPLRVAGPPPLDASTSLVAGTAANTVFWYTGENGTTPARQTATAQVGPSLTVAYGMRANEPAISNIVANVAALAATTYSATDPNAQASYQALSQEVTANLDATESGTQSISNIEADIANAQKTLTNATAVNTQTQTTLQNMLQGIDGVNQNQIGEQIMTLQNSLSASMSVTARLAQLSLVNFLSPVSG